MKRFTQESKFNGKEIQMEEGMQADCRVLDAIEKTIDAAVEDGAGMMVLYDIMLPKQYNDGNANDVFKKVQFNMARYQKRMDGKSEAPRYIAVRDMSSEYPNYKVAMFLPPDTRYEKEHFEDRGRSITDGQLTDWTAYKEHDLLAMCEKRGVIVRDVVPLDGSVEANDEAFYMMSELAAVKIEPKNVRTLFRSKSNYKENEE